MSQTPIVNQIPLPGLGQPVVGGQLAVTGAGVTPGLGGSIPVAGTQNAFADALLNALNTLSAQLNPPEQTLEAPVLDPTLITARLLQDQPFVISNPETAAPLNETVPVPVGIDPLIEPVTEEVSLPPLPTALELDIPSGRPTLQLTVADQPVDPGVPTDNTISEAPTLEAPTLVEAPTLEAPTALEALAALAPVVPVVPVSPPVTEEVSTSPVRGPVTTQPTQQLLADDENEPGRVGNKNTEKTAAPNTGKLGKSFLSALPQETRIQPTRVLFQQVEHLLGRGLETTPASIEAFSAAEIANSEVGDRNASTLARVDQVEFVQRLSAALARAHAESPKHLELELQPPSLGKLRIQVTRTDGPDGQQITARITVQTDAARVLLMENMANLNQNIGRQGIQFDRIHVDHFAAGSESGSDSGSQNDGDQPQNSEQQSDPNHSSSEEEGGNDLPDPISIGDLLDLVPGMDRLI